MMGILRSFPTFECEKLFSVPLLPAVEGFRAVERESIPGWIQKVSWHRMTDRG